jgi:dTMP kinase
MPTDSPLFIAFEGIDGSGKSTQMNLLAHRLADQGHALHLTCEPTFHPIGTLIRQAFTGDHPLDDRVIAGLFVADRLQHILDEEQGILRRLEEGFTVLTDRYYLSSYAYQGAHMPLEWVIEANALAARLCRPDLHVFIELAPEEALDRIRQRSPATQLYETLSTLTRVRDTYYRAMELIRDEETIVRVDGSKTLEAIAEEVWSAVQRQFPALEQPH